MSDIFERVKAVIADALYVETNEILRSSLLMKDLGAESIDFLDIVFRIEKEFSIKLPRGDLERRARGVLADGEFAVDGVIQPLGLKNLKLIMPEIDFAKFSGNIRLRDLPSFFTVATFERMVREQLDTLENTVGSSQSLDTGILVTRPG